MWITLCRWILSRSPSSFRVRHGEEVLADLTRRSAHEPAGLARRRWQVAALVDLWRTMRRERRMARSPLWADIGGDVRYAVRGWRRHPAYALTVVVTMAIGLGLAAAIFAFADGYLFRPLPFPGGDRVYRVSDPKAQIASALKATEVVALRDTELRRYGFVEWNTRDTGELDIDGRKVSVLTYEVSQGFRDTVALPLLAGRAFEPADHAPHAPRVAWLSHRFWMKEFGGDPAVVGRRVPFASLETTAAGADVTVVGILGPAFTTLDLNNPPPALVQPARAGRPLRPTTLSFPLVRIPPGETPATVEARIAGVLQAVAPAAEGDVRVVRLTALRELQTRGGRPTARVLLVGALLVLALAASSLIHLLLGRSAVRHREFATRLALGASRWRVVRVFLVEAVLLGGAGVAAGLLAGHALSALIASRIPQLPSGGRSLALVPMLYDWRVVTAAVALGGVLVLLGGLWPAWRVFRWSAAPGRVPRGVFRGILASETAMATIVLAGAATIGVGIFQYLHQPLGFAYEDRVNLVPWGPDGRVLRGVEAEAALTAVRATSGVRLATLATTASGRVTAAPNSASDVTRVEVMQMPVGWIETWGVTLREGRAFVAQEHVARADAAIVTDVFAATTWPHQSALGQTVVAGGASRTVVGVIDSPRWRLSGELQPTVYVPADREGLRAPVTAWVDRRVIAEIEAGQASVLTVPITSAQPGVTVEVRVQTFDDLFMRDVGEPRFQTPIVTAFGALALALAGIGIFGLVSYLVTQRTREFGIRVAVGASRVHVWRCVVGEALLPVAAGLIIGLAVAVWLGRFIEATVFGAFTAGLPVLAGVGGVIVLAAVAAALVPAGRAARVNPVVVLRAD